MFASNWDDFDASKPANLNEESTQVLETKPKKAHQQQIPRTANKNQKNDQQFGKKQLQGEDHEHVQGEEDEQLQGEEAEQVAKEQKKKEPKQRISKKKQQQSEVMVSTVDHPKQKSQAKKRKLN